MRGGAASLLFQDGLALVTAQPELIQQIVYSLELRNDAIRENAFTILNVITWVSSEGNNIIYNAFDSIATSRGQVRAPALRG